MVTIYAWLEIRATYLDEDLHPEIDEEKIYEEVNDMVKSLKHNEIQILEKNYSRYIQFSVLENHRTERTDEMLGVFEKISTVATGSYGMLYFLDDEDKELNDGFRVFVSKKGKCTWEKDKFFSPCSRMIEDAE